MSNTLKEIEKEIDVALSQMCAYVQAGVMDTRNMKKWLIDYFENINKLDSWCSLWLYVKKDEGNGVPL